MKFASLIRASLHAVKKTTFVPFLEIRLIVPLTREPLCASFVRSFVRSLSIHRIAYRETGGG